MRDVAKLCATAGGYFQGLGLVVQVRDAGTKTINCLTGASTGAGRGGRRLSRLSWCPSLGRGLACGGLIFLVLGLTGRFRARHGGS